MARLLQEAAKVAKRNTSVLLLGETGVGKGLFAETIHAMSARRQRKLIAVNGGGLSAGIVASELFGHEKGAFTGAVKRHVGYFEEADGSTLFLDEIGDMSMDSQQRLLHVLETGRLTRVGGIGSVPVDVRVIAATNVNLKRAVQAGRFRADLYHRLRIFPLRVPPLRKRREDIPMLAAHFVRRYAREFQRSVPNLSDEVMAYLQGYAWPGNVRELDNCIHRAMILCEGEVLEIADVLLDEEEEEDMLPPASAPSVPLVEAGVGRDWPGRKAEVAQAEKQQIEEALQATKGRIYGEHGAAQWLGIGPEKLRYYMRKYGVKRPKKA